MSLPTQAMEARCPRPPAPSACEARHDGHRGGSQPGMTTPGSMSCATQPGHQEDRAASHPAPEAMATEAS